MVKTLFIASVFKIKIEGDLGEGLDVFNGIKLTNNYKFVSSLLTEDLIDAIGELEKNALEGKSDCVFYSIIDMEINLTNVDQLLCNFLADCNIFLHDLWLVKDNCAEIMMGFVEYPYYKPSNLIYLNQRFPVIHSNSITGGIRLANGKFDSKIEFSLNEILQAIELYEKEKIKLIPFNISSKETTFHKENTSRLTLSYILTKTARTQSDLLVKISLFCMALEALFSTDNNEISHKLAERVAFFLETIPKERERIFKEVKEIYAMRSTAVHGSIIYKRKILDDLVRVSINADNILRNAYIKIIPEKKLDELFRIRSKNNAELVNEYFNKLIFGTN